MKVYRYLSKRELDAFMVGDMDSVGAEYSEKPCAVSNTHKYEEGVKYLHFFKNLEDLKHINKVRTNTKEHFVCQFDIPFLTLLTHTGVGYYETSGYDSLYETVREFAVPVDKIQPDYLKAYVSTTELSKENISGGITQSQINCEFSTLEIFSEDFSQ